MPEKEADIVDKPINYFNHNIDKFSKNQLKLKNRIRNISISRVLFFFVSVIGIYIGVANGNTAVILISLAGAGVFIYLIVYHTSLEKQRNWVEALIKINQREKDLIEGGNFEYDGGNEFLSASHPYAEDLDIFGKKSIFQLVNRSATAFGRNKLAHRLTNPVLDHNKLIKRQEAVSELSKLPDWRQKFQATGYLFSENSDDQNGIINWSKSNKSLFNKWYYKLMLVLNPIIGFGVIALIEMEMLNPSVFFMFLILPFYLVGTRLSVLNKIHTEVSKKSGLLLKYSGLFKIITNEKFKSAQLVAIKTNVSEGRSAHMAVKKLAAITKSMDYRLNMLVGFFLNVFFLWDIKQAIKIEKWKSIYSSSLESWFNNLSTIDELQSFAGFSFIFSKGAMPELTKGDFQMKATNLRHPFIKEEKSVGNPVDFSGWNEFKIITGANMAGKSTYLRTIGVNMVLAMSGCTVLADKFVLTPTNIFTGIKTTDSLQDGESYFFAELKRLKELITILEKGNKLFVILDEVLKGTNSADKQKGSIALITQLLALNASGIIATHDLVLGTLVDSFPNNIRNHRFEVEMSDNQLVFDYLLKDGISQNLNATFLMQKMGITV